MSYGCQIEACRLFPVPLVPTFFSFVSALFCPQIEHNKTESLWGDEVGSLNEVCLSLLFGAVWGRGKMKNRRAKRLHFSRENRDLNSENVPVIWYL